MRLLLNRSARGSSPSERKVHARGTSTERISRFWSLFNVDLAPRVAASLDRLAMQLEQIPDYTEPFFTFKDVRRVEHGSNGGDGRNPKLAIQFRGSASFEQKPFARL